MFGTSGSHDAHQLDHELDRVEDYRLAITCQAVPIAIQRGQTGDVPVSMMLAMKPTHLRGKPERRYVTLRNVGYGLAAAYEAVWGPARIGSPDGRVAEGPDGGEGKNDDDP